MRALGRALALSAAMWLVCSAIVGTAEAFDGGRGAEQQRHLDVHSILDPVGVVGHIGETLGQAGRVLGLRVADAVADLVSSAFGHGPHGHGQPQAPGYGHPAPAREQAARPGWTRGDPGTLPASMQPVTAGSYYHPQAVQTPPPSVLGGILRLLGLDSSKLGAIALNGVIFLAQLISSSLTGRPGAPPGRGFARGSAGGTPHADDAQRDSDSPDSKRHDTAGDDPDVDEDEDGDVPAGTPLSWILDNPALKGSATLHQAQDPDLPERLIEEIQRRFPRQRLRQRPGPPGPGAEAGAGGRRSRSAAADDDEPVGPGGVGGVGGGGGGRAGGGGTGDTSCIQLLVCKAGPFLRGMQRSLRPVLRPEPPGHAPPDPKGDTGDPRDSGQSGPGQQTAEEVDEARRWRGLTPVQRMFAHMPTTAEVLDQADTCAQRFPNCKVSY